jgi:hypothetical protein
MNLTLRGGRVTHEEFLQQGKGKDVGFQQLVLFEAKLASGGAEAMLSRDVHRLGSRLDVFRLYSFFYSNIGFYLTSALLVVSMFAYLYGQIWFIFSGVQASLFEQGGTKWVSRVSQHFNTEWTLQMGMLLTLPVFVTVGAPCLSGFCFMACVVPLNSANRLKKHLQRCPVHLPVHTHANRLHSPPPPPTSYLCWATAPSHHAQVGLEQGFKKAVVVVVQTIATFSPLYYIFQTFTRFHYYDQTLLHGGATYKATGRGFTIKHASFSLLYRFYARSHLYTGLELGLLLLLQRYVAADFCGCAFGPERTFGFAYEPSPAEWREACFKEHHAQVGPD